MAQFSIISSPEYHHNPSEETTTYTRTDGRIVDMTVGTLDDQPLLVVGIASDQEYNQGIWHQHLELSAEEACLLRAHLNRPEVVAILDV